jgi:hypothetical protein
MSDKSNKGYSELREKSKVSPIRKRVVMKRSLFRIAPAICSVLILLGCVTTGPENIEKKHAIGLQGHTSKGGTPFIDVHNHLIGRYVSRPGIHETDYEGAARVALDEMNRLGIKKMLVMPPPFPPDHPNRYTFEDLIGIVKKYPDRFAFLGGGGTLNVMIQQAVREGTTSERLKNRFEKTAIEILSKGAIGFGELTSEHLSLNFNHPYESAPPDHPLFLLLSDIAGRHGVPIDIHMEAVPEDMPLPKLRRLESPHNPRVLHVNIPAFERLLAHNRNTEIIWAHVGWCNTGRRTAALCGELLERHPNLSMSFKISQDSMRETRPLTEDLRMKPEWLDLIGSYPERFLIGSDRFYVTPRANIQIGPPKREGEGPERLLALLPVELARKVGYENAMRFFKFEK